MSVVSRPSLLSWILLAALVGGAPLVAQGVARAPDEGPWVVRVSVGDRAGVDRLRRLAEPWAIYPDKGMALLAVDADTWDRIVAAGFEIRLDEERTARLSRPIPADPIPLSGIPGFFCYRTVEETYSDAEELTAANPGLVDWIDIGDSWERVVDPAAGFDLRALRIGAGDGSDKPRLVVVGGIHPREYTTAELAMRFAESLVDGYGEDPEATWILDEHEIYVVPMANPDGRVHAEQGSLWRKNTDDLFCSGTDDRGVDLNRNFGFAWGCCGGSSGQECASTFRGPFASSEPETLAVQELMRGVFPDQRPPDLETPAGEDAVGVFLDLHSFGEDVLWSWGFTPEQPPDGEALYSLGRKLAFYNDYRPQHGSLSTVDGATKDFAYGELGVPGFTIELGTDFFQDCASFEFSIAPDNLEMLLYAAKTVRAPYREPAGPETVDLSVPPRVFVVGETIDVAALVDDTRYNQSNGLEPTQAIVAAEASIDDPPWVGATLPLLPADGVFDSPSEAVSLTLDTAGLAAGRHTLFVRGQDANGAWGVPTAEFFHLVEPGRAATIEGRVVDAISGAPVAAQVGLGPFEARTDARTGDFSLRLPPALAVGVEVRPLDPFAHRPGWVGAIELAPAERARLVTRLDPLLTLAIGRPGDPSWVANGEWRDVPDPQRPDARLWSDAAGESYRPSREARLTSEPIDLSVGRDPLLVLEHGYDFESSFDFGIVEAAVVGRSESERWIELRRFSGREPVRSRVWIDLERFAGQTVRLRLRSISDATVSGAGWRVAEVRVLAGPPDGWRP